jgi:hypothetical protein
MLGDPELRAPVMGLVVEDAVRAVVVPGGPVDGVEQVIGAVRRDLLRGLLGAVAGPGEVPVQHAGTTRLASSVAAVLAPTQYCFRPG